MDKREFPRYEKDLTMGYAYPDKKSESDHPGRILNISLGGVYMLSGTILEKDTPVTLRFTINKDGDLKKLTTTGSVLRSGKLIDNPDMAEKYNIRNLEGECFAVVKFEAPFIELSFMLH